MIRREVFLWSLGTVASAGLGMNLRPALQDLQEQQDLNNLLGVLKPQVIANESYGDLYTDLDRVNQRVIGRFFVSAAEAFVVWFTSACLRNPHPSYSEVDPKLHS